MILIDLGAELTEVAVYYGNAVQYTAVFPGGGESLTNEISIKTQLSKNRCRKSQSIYGARPF